MERWTEPILHVDMDAFFVEVERLRNPDLAGKPVAVGGDSARSVIAAASYEARDFGVHSAMPTVSAKRRCPQLVIVAPDHSEYQRISEEVFELFRSYTPLVEGLSVDEAFLDVGGLRHHFDSSRSVAVMIRAEVRSKLGLPCSVGVARSKFVAKLASAAAKPDGILVIPVSEEIEFVQSRSLPDLWGIGPATLAALARIGITTVCELAAVDLGTLSRSIGDGLARHLHDLSLAIDQRPVEPVSETKSISAEETFVSDLITYPAMEAVLRVHADRVGSRLRRHGVKARTITIKIRFTDFTTITRSETLAQASATDLDLYRVAVKLLRAAVPETSAVRLLGLGGSQLEAAEAGGQLSLLEGRPALEGTIDAIRERFGHDTIGPARSDRQD